jgi:hypothetical protein
MKRLFAIVAFLVGGMSVEIAKPLHCSLMQSSQPRIRRNKLRYSDGK